MASVFDEEYNRKFSKDAWIEREKQKILTNFIDTGNLPPSSKYYNKVGLPDNFIEEIFRLTKNLCIVGEKNKTGVLLVSLSPDFERTGGFDLFLDPNTKLCSFPFRHEKDAIGKVVNTYKIAGGDIYSELSNFKLFKEMLLEGNGPILEKSRMDKKKWRQSMSSGDVIEIIIDPDKKRPLLMINSKTPVSSLRLYSYISQKERTNENTTFGEFFKPSKLRRLYQNHVNNCSRNNRRVAWELQRFFGVKISGVEDTKAKRDNPYEDAFPLMGTVWTSQSANVLSYHELFDLKKYIGYLNAVKRGKEIGMFTCVDKKPCVIFHFRTFENKKFKQDDIENNEKGQNWNKLLRTDNGQHILYRMKRIFEAMRVCSFPMIYQPQQPSGAKKKIERGVEKHLENKQEEIKSSVVVKIPKQFEMKKEMLNTKRVESNITAETLQKVVGLRNFPMLECNVEKENGEVKDKKWHYEPSNGYKTAICSGIQNYSLNKGAIEQILYDTCIRINID